VVAHTGVVTVVSTDDESLAEFAAAFAHAIARHRHFERQVEIVPV
jgi:hypothetical protein